VIPWPDTTVTGEVLAVEKRVSTDFIFRIPHSGLLLGQWRGSQRVSVSGRGLRQALVGGSLQRHCAQRSGVTRAERGGIEAGHDGGGSREVALAFSSRLRRG
jgi:hypothetical protein